VAFLLDIYFIRQFFHLITRYQSWQLERWWRSRRSCFNHWHRNHHYGNWLWSLFRFFRRCGELGFQRACAWSIFAASSDASGGDRTMCGNLYHRDPCSLTVLGTS